MSKFTKSLKKKFSLKSRPSYIASHTIVVEQADNRLKRAATVGSSTSKNNSKKGTSNALFEADKAVSDDPNMNSTDKMWRSLFNMYDTDHSGSIDCKELKLIIEELGYECSLAEVLEIMRKFDIGETGTIDFKEFLSLVEDWIANDDDQIREAFEVFDRDGTGFLSFVELERALTAYGGEEFTQEEAQAFFNEIDADGSGTISADEFITFIKKIGSLVKNDIT